MDVCIDEFGQIDCRKREIGSLTYNDEFYFLLNICDKTAILKLIYMTARKISSETTICTV